MVDSGCEGLLLKARGLQRVFFGCPLCGVAWSEPPETGRLDAILSLTDFAPSGVELPTAEEVRRAGFALSEVSFDTWYPLLEDRMGESGREDIALVGGGVDALSIGVACADHHGWRPWFSFLRGTSWQ